VSVILDLGSFCKGQLSIEDIEEAGNV
jgi:hypothetical protein